MAEIPDIVRSRLRPAGQPSAHPDANLLAAFAEQALSAPEREAVTAHLAQCANCREYLAVAFQAQEPEQAADAAHAARPVRRWFPAWRWVAPAAAACCIVGVALRYYVFPTHQESAPRPVARSVMSPAPEPATVNQSAAVPRAAAPAGKPRRAAKKMEARKFSAPPPRIPADTAALQSNPELAAPSPQPRANAAVLEQSRDTVARAAREARAGAAPPQPGANAGFLAAQSGGAFAKANKAAPRIVAPVAANLTPAQASVRWSINASPDAARNARGVVERSEDAGRSWQVVPLSERLSFFAVAAAGPQVWAGGSEGALFHSSDAGAHWVEITVSDSQTQLTGAIVHIDAVSASLVRITTSTGEHWTSADGGRSWQQQ